MKKNPQLNKLLCYYRHRRKQLFFMKNLFILLIIGLVQVNATTLFSQKNKVNIHLQNSEFSKLIEAIEAQSELGFIYNENEVEKIGIINVSGENRAVDEILQEVLEGTGLTWEVLNKTIIIKPLPFSEDDLKQEMKKIKGKIVDGETGEPLVGVNVYISGTPVGTISDSEGNYELQLPKPYKEALTFSFIGYENQEVVVGNQSVINISMLPVVSQVDEVVITGYQTIEAHKSTSAVTTIKKEELNLAGAVSVDQMLEGVVAGMTTVNNSGTVGAAPKIRIRGTSSIIGTREPVWVIDGIMYEDPVKISAEDLNNLDNLNLIGNAISGLNPEDIERIDVLKDASATAIYGVRAANGVIVVTTKKGKAGKMTTNYSNNFQVSLRPSYSRMDLMNSQQRVDVSKEIQERGLRYPNYPSPVGYEGVLQDLYARRISIEEFDQQVRRLETMNTDWYDLLFDNSFSQTHNLSLSGGDDKTTYYFSGSFSDANDVERGVGLNKYTALMRINTWFNDKLGLDVKLSANYSKKNYNHSSLNLFKYGFNTSRAIPFEEDGERVSYIKEQGSVSYPKHFNILNELDNTGREITTKGIDLIANLNYHILEGLKYTSTLGVNLMATNNEEYATEHSYYIADMRGYDYGIEVSESARMKSTVPFGGELKTGNTNLNAYTFRNQLTYGKSVFETHDLNVVAGTELRSKKYKGTNTVKLGYLPDRGHTFAYIDPKEYERYATWLRTNPGLVVTDQVSNFVSFYTAVTYDINRRYVLNFNLRTDGSNNFGQDSNDRFLPVWSVSGKWNIHEEKFLKNSEKINLLSLRTSYGFQGNVVESETPNLIVRPQAINPITKEYYSNLTSLPNPYLRWEKTKSYNIGLDYGFFNNILRGSVEYYQKNGEDLIMNQRVSSVNGVSTVVINGANMKNTGLEFSVTADCIRSSNWNWSNTFNVAHNENKVVSALVGQKDSNPYRDYLDGTIIKEGTSTDDFYAYQFAGLNAHGLPAWHNLTIEEGEKLTEEEYYNRALKNMGSRLPLISGGLVNNVRYKNLNLSISWSYSLGSKRRMPSLYNLQFQTIPTADQNMSSEYVNRWQQPGDENKTDIPSLSDEMLLVRGGTFGTFSKFDIADSQWQMYNDSDIRVVSGDFLRLRSMTLSYSIPRNWIEKYGIQNASVRFQAQNLFVIKDKALKSLDPEQISADMMPVPTTFNLGFNISF
ncbi:SusC/RagA family TonB-linked outer membrane protein [Marinilabiliaceae bacterium JC017]|nr:SusC/RagA family TonB-linked outer membrane protein [Marinilabiliaceae bacterium JC017]